MREQSFKLVVAHWPYGLEVKVVDDGLLLKPRRKARANWSRQFKRLDEKRDELADVRKIQNEFDQKGWEW